MRTAKLGQLEVSRIGLGAMGMSHGYAGAGTDDAKSICTIHRALDLGVTLVDTAEIYGPYTNEELVGRALRGRRDEVVLATKFGLVAHDGRGPWTLDSSPDNIRVAVDGWPTENPTESCIGGGWPIGAGVKRPRCRVAVLPSALVRFCVVPAAGF